MEYLFVLNLIARHPLYLLSPQCYQPASIKELVAERISYINEVIRSEDLYGEYASCIKRADGANIDYSICDHDQASFQDHENRVQELINSGDRAEFMSIRLGEKIERLMRKKLRT